MKGCVQWNSVWEDFASSGDRTRSARSVGQSLTHWATGAPKWYEDLMTTCINPIKCPRVGLGTGQFFRYDIRIGTYWSIFDISFDTCVKDCYIWNICKIFPVMWQYCHLLYFPHNIIIYVFLKLKLTIPLRLCVFLETPQLKRMLRHSEKQEKLKWHKSVRTGSNMSCCFIIVVNDR